MADLITMKPKYPDEALDYSMDWSKRLLTGENIAAHTATIVRGTASVSAESMATPLIQLFWLSGGVANDDTLVKLEITTDSVPPRVHEVLVRVRIVAQS